MKFYQHYSMFCATWQAPAPIFPKLYESNVLKKEIFFFKLVFFINKINALERNPAVRLFYKQHHVLYTWLFYGVLIFYFRKFDTSVL